MASRDLKSGLDISQSLIPAVRTASATGAGVNIVGYGGALVVFEVGTIATIGTWTPVVMDSADGTTFAAVAGGTGTAVAGTFTGIQRLGYVGTAQFVAGALNFGGTGAGGITAISVIRGFPSRGPLS